MQLTRFTDYALRALLFVGRHDDRTCTMGEIADYFRISQEHLRKVIHELAKSGYLDTRRGRGGGIVLGTNPEQIRIGEVILATEEDLSIVDCDALDCILSPGCSIKEALDRGSRAFVAALNEVTLADLLQGRRMKQQFKSIDITIGADALRDQRRKAYGNFSIDGGLWLAEKQCCSSRSTYQPSKQALCSTFVNVAKLATQ